MMSIRSILGLALTSLMLTTATAHGQKIEPTCGPKVKRSLVRVLDVTSMAPDEAAQFVVQQVGPFEISTEETVTAQTIFGRAWKLAEGIAAKRGCDVLIVLSEWTVEDGYIVSENPALGITTSTPRRFSRAQVIYAKSSPEHQEEREAAFVSRPTAIEIQDWEVFENDFLRFEYPADWQQTPGNGVVLVELSTPSRSRTPPVHCQVNRLVLPNDFELRGEELLEVIQEEPKSLFGDSEASLEIQALRAGTALVGELSGTVPNTEEEFKAAVVLAPRADDLFLFRCDTLAEDFQSWLPVFVHSVATLEFKPPLRASIDSGQRSLLAHRSRVETSSDDVVVLANGAVLELLAPSFRIHSGRKAILFSFENSCRLWHEGGEVLPCTLLREPEGVVSKVNVSKTHLKDLAADGAVLVLEDGAVFEVDPLDQITTPLWLTMTEILVLEDREILNVSTGELISVSRLR